MQAFQALLPVALAPLADGHARQAHSLGDRCVGFASTAGQDDLGALHDRMRERARAGNALQLLNLVIAEDQLWHRTTKRQGAPRETLRILEVISGTTH